jgi:hypothetical protein
MAGYKTWAVNEEVLAVDLNGYVQSQVVARFPNATARTAQLPAPAVNQLSMRDDAFGVVERWNGTAWVVAGPGAEIVYTQTVTSVTVVNTNTATSHVFVDGSAATYDGSPVIVEVFCPYVTSPPGAQIYIGLYDGTTYLTQLGAVSAATVAIAVPVHARYRLTPTIGSHAYRVGTWVASGTGRMDAGGAFVPGFIRVTRA